MIYKAMSREAITVSNTAVGLNFDAPATPSYGTVTSGTATITGSPVTLSTLGANTVTSGATTGNATLWLPPGYNCTVASVSGGGTISGSPVTALQGASTTITWSGAGAATFTTALADARYNYINIVYARIQCLTANIRFTVNGTTPIASTKGELMYVGDVIEVWGHFDLANFLTIRDTSSDGAIEVTYFGQM